MSAFEPGWLALREPYDHAARDRGLIARFAAALGAAPGLVDLGCGTGANLRCLAPHLGPGQRWRCLDHDAGLLAAAPGAARDWAEAAGWRVRARAGGFAIEAPAFSLCACLEASDLAQGVASDLAPAAGLTASALLDLTSAAWLERLALACCGRPALFALSFDGRLAFEPEAGEDREIRRRFVRHQRTDKGFGPALGPDAAKHLADRLRMQGSEVALAPSDWRLGPADRTLLQAMLEGLVLAVREVEDDALLAGWAQSRCAQAQEYALGMTVGHLDLLALPR